MTSQEEWEGHHYTSNLLLLAPSTHLTHQAQVQIFIIERIIICVMESWCQHEHSGSRSPGHTNHLRLRSFWLWWHQSHSWEWVVPERAVGKWWQWFKCPRLWLTAARQPRSLHHSDGRRQPHNNQQSDVEAIRASLHWTHPTCSFFLRTFIIECKLPNLIYVSLNTIPWL